MSKTIEISRELLQHALNSVEYLAMRADDIGESNAPVADALRALLAAPVVERQEPVAWALDVEGYKTVIIDNYQRALSEQEHFHWRGRTAVIRDLYTSPLAPVAVLVLPDRMDCKGIWPSPNLTAAEHICDTWNACLDKVKELNQ